MVLLWRSWSSVLLSRSVVALALPPDSLGWLVEDRAPDVAVELGVGLECPLRGGDLLVAWLEPRWWLEDWPPPWCPTPLLTLGIAPVALA